MTSQRVSRGLHWAALLVAAITLLLTCLVEAAFAREIATCGSSRGYSYYPKFGLAAADNDAGKWTEDAISSGKFTLTQTSEKEFDLLIADATGRVFSASQDGGVVLPTRAVVGSVSVILTYPATGVTETYTFFRNADGKAEAIWTANKGGGSLIMKVGAYRAVCSFFAY